MIEFHLNSTGCISQIRHTIGHTWKCKAVSANSLLCITRLSFWSLVICFLMHVFCWIKNKHLFCKMGPLTFYSLISCNRLHTVIFSAMGSAVLCSHSSPAHLFPDSKLCVRVMSGHQLGPKVCARSLAESSPYLMAGLTVSVYIL